MVVVLPQELIDAILDHLYDDIVTLGVCSLTGNTMLHRSRVHKFAVMTISASTSSSAAASGETIDPAITRYIRHLIVVRDYDGMWDTVFECTNLHRLSLRGVRFTTFPRNYLACRFPFALLESLELFSCSFVGPSAPNIARFVCGFTKLASLYVGDARWPISWRTGMVEPLNNSPSFSGELHLLHRSQMVDVLTSFPSGVRFKTIVVEGVATVDDINNIVVACGTSLRTLRLRNLTWPEESPPLDLSQNDNLNHLTLPNTFHFQAYQPLWLVNSAQNLSSNSLRFVEFSFFANPNDGRATYQLNWSNLDTALCNEEHLPNLERVRVSCSPENSESYVQLPKLRARGLLEVVDEKFFKYHTTTIV